MRHLLLKHISKQAMTVLTSNQDGRMRAKDDCELKARLSESLVEKDQKAKRRKI